MKGHKAATPILAALAIAALTLYAYRELPARPFAADDYQWLLNVRGLSIGEVTRKAFDPGAQSHFYRPLVWLLFWTQTRAFGLDPRGFHAVSLGLHLLNAGLVGGLAYRLTTDHRPPTTNTQTLSSSSVFRLSSALVASAIVALHPAAFEAVVWVSSQSELLAAALLLAALLLWTTDDGRRTTDDGFRHSIVYRLSSIVGGWPALLATLALGLALLAKESAVIGLPLLILLGRGARIVEQRTKDEREPRTKNQEPVSHKSETTVATQFSILNSQFSIRAIVPYLLPTLITLGYVALQVVIERRNYLLAQGGYGIGPQLVLNPLRSLALIVVPLAGSEHADAAWLAPVGGLVALGLLLFLIHPAGAPDFRFWMRARREQSQIPNPKSQIVLALGLTLLPTAPFISPPDSRYLYLPVMAGALLVGLTILDFRFWITIRQSKTGHPSGVTQKSKMGWFVLVAGFLVLFLAWAAAGELHAREERFAAASGPGGSLWRVAQAVCAAGRPDRMVIVDPPLAPPHAEAIVGLACGNETRAKIVGRDQVAKAIKGHSVVIAFPNGSAEIEQWT
jgi:hypothetical protein